MGTIRRYCNKRHKQHAIMTVVALWDLSVMTFVAPCDVCWYIMVVELQYNVCRLWRLSHYGVCRQLWSLSLKGLVAVSIRLRLQWALSPCTRTLLTAPFCLHSTPCCDVWRPKNCGIPSFNYIKYFILNILKIHCMYSFVL